MPVMKCISEVGVLAMLSTFALGQVAPAQNPPVVKHVPISKTSSSSGKEMFKTHFCRVPWSRWQGHRASHPCHEDQSR